MYLFKALKFSSVLKMQMLKSNMEVRDTRTFVDIPFLIRLHISSSFLHQKNKSFKMPPIYEIQFLHRITNEKA